MPIPTLPEDVLEIIFDCVHDKTASPARESRSTFASLCLVSKTFLPLARVRLYYRPFRSEDDSSRNVKRIINTLQTAISLRPLVRILLSLGSSPSYLPLFDLCPHVVALGLDCSYGKPTKSQLLVALKPLIGVRKLSLVCPTSPSFDWRSFALEILAFPAFGALQDLLLRTGSTNNKPLLHAPVLLPLKSLTIDSTLSFETVGSFLPDNMSTLKSLVLNRVKFTSMEMQKLVESLPPTIISLSLGAQTKRCVVFAQEYRRTRFSFPHVPSHPFVHLSSLTTLDLPNTQGPSLALLMTLASCCRQLVEVDFFGSVWTSDASLPSELTAEEHFDLVFPQEAIILALQSLPKLKKINLGYLMYSDKEEKGFRLKNVLEEGGFEVEWGVVYSGSDDSEDDDESYESDDSESDSEESRADSENDTEAPRGEEEEAEASA